MLCSLPSPGVRVKTVPPLFPQAPAGLLCSKFALNTFDLIKLNIAPLWWFLLPLPLPPVSLVLLSGFHMEAAHQV